MNNLVVNGSKPRSALVKENYKSFRWSSPKSGWMMGRSLLLTFVMRIYPPPCKSIAILRLPLHSHSLSSSPPSPSSPSSSKHKSQNSQKNALSFHSNQQFRALTDATPIARDTAEVAVAPCIMSPFRKTPLADRLADHTTPGRHEVPRDAKLQITVCVVY